MSYLIGSYTSTVNGTSKNYTYTYDSKGNITSIIQGENEITYTSVDFIHQSQIGLMESE